MHVCIFQPTNKPAQTDIDAGRTVYTSVKRQITPHKPVSLFLERPPT